MISHPTKHSKHKFYSTGNILQDFLKDEETTIFKNIDDTESLVKTTKTIIQNTISNNIPFATLKEHLIQINKYLETNNESLEEELTYLTEQENNIKQDSFLLQKKEEIETEKRLHEIEQVKHNIDKLDFVIKNTERIYTELENRISSNIIKNQSNKKRKLFSLKEYDEFVLDNSTIKEKYELLEQQKDILLNEYNNLLKDNLLLKFENENIEIDKIKDVLEEINLLSSLRKQHKKTIVALETQYKALTEETEQITNQIKNVVHTLEGLNIDNPKLNKEITIISQQLNPYMKRLNRSFSQGYVNEDWIDANKIYEQTVKGNKYKHRWRNVLTCIN
jgi:DNA-binding transcriptional regulator YhcF (GntR family)